MLPTEKDYLTLWEEYIDGKLNAITVDHDETDKAKKKRIERLEADPEAWIAYYFPEESAAPAKFHKAATKRVMANPEWYEVRMWSRECAKSTRTMMEVLLLTLTKKKRFCLLFSSSADNAERLLMPYKANLEINPRIINDYGKQVRNGSWTQSEFTTRAGATFRAIGIGEPPRGAKTAKNVRPDILLFDDCDTDKDARNPDMVKKNWDWIDQAAIGTRSISGDTLIIFCGNRIAVDCCVVRACAFADHVDLINLTDEKGNPTWPEKNTPERIDRIKKQKSYAAFQKEYYNNPITEGSVFNEMSYKKLPFIGHYQYLVCYTDPSFKDTKKNDFKATVLVGKWRDEFHVIKAFVDQTSTAKMIEWHYEIMNIVGGRSCYYYMEEVFLQELIIQEFYKVSAATGRTIPIMGDKRSKDDKFTRIEALLEPLHSNSKLWLNEDLKDELGMKNLDQQFIAFSPGSRAHDDGPDAVEGAVWMLCHKNPITSNDIMIKNKSKGKNHWGDK